MAFVDPFVPIRDWRTSLFRGDQKVVDLFQDEIDSKLPRDWVRDVKYEATRPRPDRIRCYIFDQVGDAAVRIWLQRVTATRVRGGPVQLIRHPQAANTGRLGELVAKFADDCVLPAAGASRVLRTQPAFGPRSAVTSAAEMLFTRLADTADGEWPLTPRTKALWDELVSTCLAEGVAIDRAELRQWLEDSGWGPEAAAALSNLFFDDSEWLAKRLAVIAQ
jgi:hypothetical protein